MFVTVFAAILESRYRPDIYVSAGHDSPYVMRAGGAALRLETEGGPPLGSVDDFPFPVELRAAPARRHPAALHRRGDRGEERGERFLYQRRVSTAWCAIGARVRRQIDRRSVREDVRRFVGDAEQADDITLLAVRWIGPRAARRVSER